MTNTLSNSHGHGHGHVHGKNMVAYGVTVKDMETVKDK